MGLALRPGFLHGSVGKEAACSAGDAGDSAPGSGRSPGVGNGNPLKNICLENLVDRGAWRAAGHRVARSWARLSAQHCTQLCGTDLVFVFSRSFFFLHPNPQASDKDLLISCFCGWCFIALLSQRGYHEWVSSLHKDFSSMGFPDGSVVKNPPANAGDVGLIPRLGGSPREGNGNPFQYSYLGNPRDRGAWQAAVHRIVEESEIT